MSWALLTIASDIESQYTYKDCCNYPYVFVSRVPKSIILLKVPILKIKRHRLKLKLRKEIRIVNPVRIFKLR
jgi:hypothetical protein